MLDAGAVRLLLLRCVSCGARGCGVRVVRRAPAAAVRVVRRARGCGA